MFKRAFRQLANSWLTHQLLNYYKRRNGYFPQQANPFSVSAAGRRNFFRAASPPVAKKSLEGGLERLIPFSAFRRGTSRAASASRKSLEGAWKGGEPAFKLLPSPTYCKIFSLQDRGLRRGVGEGTYAFDGHLHDVIRLNGRNAERRPCKDDVSGHQRHDAGKETEQIRGRKIMSPVFAD